MTEKTYNIISSRTGMSIRQIQEASWGDIRKNITKHPKLRAFRPAHYFTVNGNIHMEQNKYMGTTWIDFRNTLNYMGYKLKCLMRKFRRK